MDKSRSSIKTNMNVPKINNSIMKNKNLLELNNQTINSIKDATLSLQLNAN